MSYIPQPGTIAARAIEYLKDAGPGANPSTAEILDAIGQPSTYQGLVPCMQPAIAAGVVVREREGHIFRWRLARPGDVPPPKRDQDDDHDGAGDQAEPGAAPRGSRREPVAARKVARRAVAKAKRSPQAAPEPAAAQLAEPVSASDTAESAPQPGFEAALSTSQRLIMFVDGQHVCLRPEYTRQLLTYLDRARGVSALA